MYMYRVYRPTHLGLNGVFLKVTGTRKGKELPAIIICLVYFLIHQMLDFIKTTFERVY